MLCKQLNSYFKFLVDVGEKLYQKKNFFKTLPDAINYSISSVCFVFCAIFVRFLYRARTAGLQTGLGCLRNFFLRKFLFRFLMAAIASRFHEASRASASKSVILEFLDIRSICSATVCFNLQRLQQQKWKSKLHLILFDSANRLPFGLVARYNNVRYMSKQSIDFGWRILPGVYAIKVRN